ncbi:AraC family transcriptional regulator [Sphingomonas sp. JC676]|uniref:AraC family transcriptional regulator n=1 Tax=Sphingomonas sp. JC676 TaxID=2768065 RepID=UPI0016585039|nr:AraC family transcriptional regulator [Sphingomonas sp. JC676]MBC9032723.1 AraC family transcriptional regulator [Sphingomonas sp. JC676]
MLISSDESDANRRAETADLRATMGARIERLLNASGENGTAIERLNLYRCTGYDPANATIYEPSLAVIVRGRKRAMVGDETHFYDASRFLLTAVDMPTISCVLDARLDEPFLSIMLKLDLEAARDLIADIDLAAIDTAGAGTAMATGPATLELLDAVNRLIGLLETPHDIAILGRIIEREILYRLLTGPTGARLRQTVSLGTQANRAARVIAWLRENYVSPVRVETLADVAAMGVSTLHHHFRALTGMSPLQYQKHLRLHEARRVMLSESIDAGSAALRVGYESSTQFSREYRRLFGAPPKRDVAALRAETREFVTTA